YAVQALENTYASIPLGIRELLELFFGVGHLHFLAEDGSECQKATMSAKKTSNTKSVYLSHEYRFSRGTWTGA
ncbi:MAG: hypothetical protein AAGF53_07385, partial [Pseudomonadota bacterium]